MKNTDKEICRDIAQLLAAYGVEDVVLCPGSRNAPLSLAVSRSEELNHRVVIDERSAAFVALGISVQTLRPVAIVVTSGSAFLDTAPAVAEAYYRQVPLIVVSADRPAHMIDQNDSQTIRQPGALGNVVKTCVDLALDYGVESLRLKNNRLLNDALQTAITGPKGPVHINLQLDVPLGNEVEVGDEHARKIDVVMPARELTTQAARAIGRELAPPRRVMILAGGLNPDKRLNRTIDRLAAIPNVAVVAEAQSNLHSTRLLTGIDRLLAYMGPERASGMLPDVLITIGGSVVSDRLKRWLRGAERMEHWQVDELSHAVDTYGHLSHRIEMAPETFMPQLASAMQPFGKSDNDYAETWRTIDRESRKASNAAIASLDWCGLKAFDAIVDIIPDKANLHVSNGMAIRYAQLSRYAHLHRIDSNRGVSGIDGSTSTAIGASMAYAGGPTVLITGDMSAQYDLGALAIDDIPTQFRMIVLSNGGGAIFNWVKTTRSKPETKELYVGDVRLPLKELSKAYGFRYYRAENMDQLRDACASLFGPQRCPAILEVVTDAETDAEAMDKYIEQIKNHI